MFIIFVHFLTARLHYDFKLSCHKNTNFIRLIHTGYTIPKGWKVLTWFRSVHLDPEIYPNPKEFNPNRWNVSSKKLFLIEFD